MLKIIAAVVVLILVLGFIIFKFSPILKNSKPKQVTIVYWDFWDENLMKPVLEEFEKTHSNIKISYSSQSPLNYRTRLSTQLKQGVGPDVFPIHNSWLPLFNLDLTPAGSAFNIGEYKSAFYPVAYDSFVLNNQIYAAPLGIDGLGLFINTDITTGANVSPPKNWSEFIAGATKVTVKDTNGLIKTAGAGVGTAVNVDYWSDILGLMLLQQQTVDLKNPSPVTGAEVLSFYTGFVTDPTKKVWDVNLPNSTEMFINGNLAFYFAPFSKVVDIKAANPNLKFKIVPVPQLPGGKIAFGSFWGEAVSAQSKVSKQSWEFIKFLTSSEVSKVFAIPSARIDLAPTQINDEILGPFVIQGPMYKFWYLSEVGRDGGINDEMIKTYQVAVTGVLQGQSAEGVVGTVARDTKTILEKYGVK